MDGLTGAIGIRPGEGRTVALVALLFASLEAGRGFGEIGVDTLVVSRYGAGSLPYLFIGLGSASFVAALAYGAALGRLPRIQLLAGVPIGAAVVLLIERALMATDHPATVPLAWLTVYAVGAIGVTIAWTMAGSVFDARQAKRLFPLCTGAAIAGSFVGTLSSGPVARAVGTPHAARPRGRPARCRRRPRRRRLAYDHRPGPDPSRRSVDRRQPARRLRRGRALAAHATRGDRVRAALDPALLGDVPVPAGRVGDVPVRGGPRDSARPAVGRRDRDVVRGLDRAGQSRLRQVRSRRRRDAPAARLSRGLRPVAGVVLVRDRGVGPLHAAGDPARPVERGLERVLQRRPDRATRPGARLQRRRPRPDRHDPVRRPHPRGRDPAGTRPGVLARSVDRPGLHARGGRDPARLCRQPVAHASWRARRAGPRRRTWAWAH